MPPLKTFKFENKINSRVTVIIEAYSLDEALDKLANTVKIPHSFKEVK